MDHYLDIRIHPDPEISVGSVLNTVFNKLHRQLVQQNSQDIAVSFPEAPEDNRHLGRRLRLHGPQGALEQLMAAPWLAGMQDYLQQGGIRRVPTQVQYRSIRRVQSKSNAARLRRRLQQRHQLTPEEAAQRIPDTVERLLDLPFIQMHSQSSGQRFRLFISQTPAAAQAINGTFNSYGLSPTATVPWW